MHLSRRKPARTWALVTAVAVVALLGLPAPAQSAPPAGPADVQPVCGTPQKGHVTCFAMRRLDVTGSLGRQLADTPAGYGPDDLRSAYRLPADGGAGQTVAIVDAYDDPNAEADLAVYRRQFGLPACTSADGCFRKVDQRGGTRYPIRDYVWAQEISLDLDMVSAAAPLAHLVLIEADSDRTEDMVAAVDQAVAQGAKFVSNSYGAYFTGSDEDPSETTDLDAHYNHPGVAMVAASGDRGFGVSYPAASQFVTSVGGTSLVRDDSARGFAETVWHNATGAPGSGCSLYEPKPLFQKDTGCDMRTVADVAAVSDPSTGVAVYDSYGIAGFGWSVYGGTSVAAPIITGVYAAAGAPAPGTYPNAYPYAHRAALNDVTSGDNGTCAPAYLCSAGAGYDGPLAAVREDHRGRRAGWAGVHRPVHRALQPRAAQGADVHGAPDRQLPRVPAGRPEPAARHRRRAPGRTGTDRSGRLHGARLDDALRGHPGALRDHRLAGRLDGQQCQHGR
jgi:hypothetical protein